MIPKITLLPYDCTPILGANKDKAASLSGTVLDPAQDMNKGVSMMLKDTRDISQIKPPPIVVSPITPGEWDKYTLDNDKKYLDIFRNMALGTEKDELYKYVFANKTVDLFGDEADSDAIVKQLDAMIDEIKNNFAAGATDPTANLKTKFSIGGVEFSYNEMMDAREKMQYAHDLVGAMGTADYTSYADIGTAIGYIKNYGKGIDSQQALLLNKKIAERVEQRITFAENFEQKYPTRGELKPDEKDREFYAYKDSSNATNREYTGALVKLFADLDFSDSSAVETALLKYQELIGDSMTGKSTHSSGEQRLMNGWLKDLADMQKKSLEGKNEYKHYTITTLKKDIDKVNAMRKASRSSFSAKADDAARPKSPNEIVLDHAKEAYKNDTSADSASSHYAAFGNTMLQTYKFIAEQYNNFGEWASYYRDSMREDSDLKKRAASYTDYAGEAIKKSDIRFSTLENLVKHDLTLEEEALAYRAYGDAFLTQKAAYYDQAQRNAEEYGYAMGKQYAMVSKLLDRKIQKEYGTDDTELFKLQFKRESFLNISSDKGFMEQLLLAIESIEKQLEDMEKQEATASK